jgi:hypothetical protein
MLKTVDEIAAAAERLSSAELLRLRQRLERIEKKLWKTELERTTATFRKSGLTDGDIDRMVTRRRRESRR